MWKFSGIQEPGLKLREVFRFCDFFSIFDVPGFLNAEIL